MGVVQPNLLAIERRALFSSRGVITSSEDPTAALPGQQPFRRLACKKDLPGLSCHGLLWPFRFPRRFFLAGEKNRRADRMVGWPWVGLCLGLLVPFTHASLAAEQTVAPMVAPAQSWPGPWRVGFSVGAPAVLNLRLDTILNADFEAGLAVGGIMVPLPSFLITQWNADLTLRYFHLGKYFFVGLTLRYLGFGIDGRTLLVKTDEIATSETPEFRLGGVYAVPHIGVRFRVGRSMTMSFDLGLQLAFFTFGSIHSSRLTAPVGEGPSSIYQEMARASGRSLSWMARTPFPTVSLFALSWDL